MLKQTPPRICYQITQFYHWILEEYSKGENPEWSKNYSQHVASQTACFCTENYTGTRKCLF